MIFFGEELHHSHELINTKKEECRFQQTKK